MSLADVFFLVALFALVGAFARFVYTSLNHTAASESERHRSLRKPVFHGESEESKRSNDKDLLIHVSAIRFDFTREQSQPFIRVEFRIENNLPEDLIVSKLVWKVMVGSKKTPIAESEDAHNVLATAHSDYTCIDTRQALDAMSVRAISRFRQGLSIDCTIEGFARVRAGDHEFEHKFVFYNTPAVVRGDVADQTDAYIDPTQQDLLTGLFNRGFLIENLQSIVNSANVYHPVSFIMMDVDNFKQINDSYGHLVGDDVLKIVSAKIREAVHNQGFALRYAGDEFCVVLQGLDVGEVKSIAENIRYLIASYDFKIKDETISLTVSVGVATLCEKADANTLIQQADQKLLSAKRSGKNRMAA